MDGEIYRTVRGKVKHRLLPYLAMIFFLLTYGVFRFPAALSSPGGFIGECFILVAYGLAIWLWVPALELRNPQVLQSGMRNGLLIGAIFAGEIILEYILLPKDNTTMGLMEYGSVFLILFAGSVWTAYRTRRFRDGIFTAIFSAMIGSIIWLIVVLTVFYLFHGTPQQVQVFQAEGNFEDFARSGMTDFDAFIMQDFWGAGFFHFILLLLFAGVLGGFGSLIGKISAGFRNHSKE